MVQRKQVGKLGTQTESKLYPKLEKKQLSEHPAAAKNKAGVLQKMKIRKSGSFKLTNSESFKLRKEQLRRKKQSSDESNSSQQKKPSPSRKSEGSSPNYMKSTSSSHAKKESHKVSPKSQTTTRCASSKDVSNSKMVSSPTNKSPKTLKKNSSLKPIRSLMKKSSTIPLYSKPNVGRATCSSTLKDSKYPAYLDFHPDGSEMDRISVMKVCPYTYCSLNGYQHHEPLPPLKRFLSLRRKLLRTQRSMKLKGISATDINYNGNDNREIDTEQVESLSYLDVESAGSKFSPLIEDASTDFFIQIYVKPMKETRESNYEPKLLSNASSPYLDENTVITHDEIELWMSDLSDAEKEDGTAVERQIHEPETNAARKGNINQMNSYDAVIDISTPFNLAECNEKGEEEETESMLPLAKTNSMEMAFDCWIGGDVDLKERNSQDVDPVQELVCNPAPVDIPNWDAEETEHCPLEISYGYHSNTNGNNLVDVQKSPEIDQSTTEALKGQDEVIRAKIGETRSETEINLGYAVSNHLSKDNQNPEVATGTNVDAQEDTLYEDDKNKDQPVRTKNHDCGWNEGRPGLNTDAAQENRCDIEPTQIETKDVSNLVKKQISPEKDQILQTEAMSTSLSKGNQFSTFQEERGEDELKKTEFTIKNPVNHLQYNAKQPSPKANRDTKREYKREAKQTIEKDLSPEKEFNPRGPNFLPLEPSPETEKVELRHQLMDDRRSPEEWMLDYAIRRAVSKLDPARKRRVALLIEAFETVIPVQNCEHQLQGAGAAASFTRATPIQACS